MTISCIQTIDAFSTCTSIALSLLTQHGNRRVLNCLTTLFRLLGCLNSRVATEEERQHCADGTADQDEQKGIVQAHRHCVLRHTGLKRLDMLTHLLDAGSSHSTGRAGHESGGNVFGMDDTLLRQVGGENRYTYCTE